MLVDLKKWSKRLKTHYSTFKYGTYSFFEEFNDECTEKKLIGQRLTFVKRYQFVKKRNLFLKI